MKYRLCRVFEKFSTGFVRNGNFLNIKTQIFLLLMSVLLNTLLFIQCVSSPDVYDEDFYSIKLSLEKNGRDSAEYSGTPILATLEFDDTVSFSDIAWRTGNGKLIIPENMAGKSSDKFEVYLYWLIYPAKKDSATKAYIDTIYVSTGGNLKTSNKVRVKVNNLPVVVDSAKIGDMVFSGLDPTWRWSTTRPISSVPFRFYARDLDGKVPDISFADNKGKIVMIDQKTLQYTYTIPQGVILDTISITFYDHYGSNIYKSLIMRRFIQSTPPVIDSVLINGQNIGYYNGCKVAYPFIDTLEFIAYAHDPENTSITYQWSSTDTSMLRKGTTTNSKTFFICNGNICKDTLKDSALFIDAIKFIAYDIDEDSTVGNILLYKGVFNEPPIIDSVSIDDSLFTRPGTTLRYPVLVDSSITVRLWARDPEGGATMLSWKAPRPSSISDTTGTKSVYTALSSIGQETVKVNVSDGSKVTVLNLVFKTTDGTPAFDSLVVGRAGYYTIFKGTDQLFHYAKTVFDSLPVAVYASPTTARGTLSYKWEANNKSIFREIVDNRAQIILPGNDIKDTIIVLISDGIKGYKVKLEVSGS